MVGYKKASPPHDIGDRGGVKRRTAFQRIGESLEQPMNNRIVAYTTLLSRDSSHGILARVALQ